MQRLIRDRQEREDKRTKSILDYVALKTANHVLEGLSRMFGP